MRGPRRSALVLALVVVAAACGDGDEDVAGPGTSGSVAPEPATASTVDAPSTVPPTTSPATTTTTTSSTTTTTTTTTTTSPPTTSPGESCLDGTWWLSPEQTTSLYSALLPGMPVTVAGTHWVEFAGDTADVWTLLEVRFAVGGTDVTFGMDQHGVGTYTVVDDVLSISYDTFESTIHEGHGEAIYDRTQDPASYADDAVDLVDDGNGTITINGVTVPVLEIPPVAGGPVGCDGDTMSLGFTSGLADAAAVYVRLA